MKPGRVDGEEHGIRVGRQKAEKRPAGAADLGKPAEDRCEAHHRDRFHRDDRVETGRAELGSTDSRGLKGHAARAERGQEVGPEAVPGGLARGDDEKRKLQTGRSSGRFRIAWLRTSSATPSAWSATSVSSQEPSGSWVSARKCVSSDSSGSRGSTRTSSGRMRRSKSSGASESAGLSSYASALRFRQSTETYSFASKKRILRTFSRETRLAVRFATQPLANVR